MKKVNGALYLAEKNSLAGKNHPSEGNIVSEDGIEKDSQMQYQKTIVKISAIEETGDEVFLGEPTGPRNAKQSPVRNFAGS